MAKTKKQEDGQVQDGYVRLQYTGPEGGYIDYPEKDAKRLLSLEKKLGIENYVLPTTDGKPGSESDKADMGEAEE